MPDLLPMRHYWSGGLHLAVKVGSQFMLSGKVLIEFINKDLAFSFALDSTTLDDRPWPAFSTTVKRLFRRDFFASIC